MLPQFDQRPEDVVELVRRYAARHPRRDRPVLVVGVRTSGSYLAPLGAAALRQLGYRRVSLLDLRPAFGVPVEDGRHLAALGSEGHVLVFDDPPSSGRSILQVAQAVEGLGVAPEPTFMMLALTAGGSLPPALEAYPEGVAEAVERLIGHRPGGCPRCVARPSAPRTRLLVALLSTDPTGRRALRSVFGAASGFAARSWSR